MILKKKSQITEKVKEIPDIELNDEEKAFADELRKLSPLFTKLKNNSIRCLLDIYKEDKQEEELTAENFLDWFNLYGGNFLDFVQAEYQRIPLTSGGSGKGSLPVFVIRDLAQNDPDFENALWKVGIKWNIVDKNHNHVYYGEAIDLPTLVEILFSQCCSYGVRDNDVDYSKETDPENIPDKSRRSFELLKELVDDLKNSIHESLNEEELIPDEVKEEETVKVEEKPEENVEEVEVKQEEVVNVDNEVKDNAFKTILTTAIQQEWDLINQFNSLIASFEFDYNKDNKEDIKTILNQLVDDATISVGMLYKIQDLISDETTKLIDLGIQKAEEIIEK